jgi:hypothetical protein
VRDRLGQFVLLRSANGKVKILIKDAEGQFLWFDAESGQNKIRLEDSAGNYILLDAEDNSIHVEDVAGDYMNMKDGIIDIYALNDVNITTGASKVHIEAPGGTIEAIAEGGTVDVQANTCTVTAEESVIVNGAEILLSEEGDLSPVARIGDCVEVGSGSSAGEWPIVTGSGKVQAGG